MNRFIRQAITGLATAALAAGGLLATGAPAHASFTSSVGGSITRSEVIERAQYWVDHQPGDYSQTSYSPDPIGSRNYRRDCSGYVDMAWHTSTDNWTGNMSDISYAISRADLRPGDILNDPVNHVFLFDQWEADHIHFSYYTFGSAPVRKVTHASIDASTLDGHPNGNYIARRYNKIVDDTPGSVGGTQIHQIWGDTSGWHDAATGVGVPAGSGISSVNMGGGWPQSLANENGEIRQVWGDSSGWHNGDTGLRVPAGAVISAVNMGGSWPQAFSVENGQVHQIWGDTGGWHDADTGLRVPAGAVISAVNMGGSWPQAFSVENGQVHQIWGDTGGWHDADTGLRVPAGAVISAVNMGGSWPQAFSVENGQVHQIWGDTGGWHDADTGLRVPAGAVISAVNMGGSWPQAFSVENGQVHQIWGDTGGWHDADTTLRVPAGSVISAVNMGGTWPQAMTIE